MSSERVPQTLYDADGRCWTFRERDTDPKLQYNLIYRRHEEEGGIKAFGIIKPSQVETDFTRTGRPEPTQKIIRQGKWECAPASLAMLLGEKLFTVKRAMGKYGWKNDDSGASTKITIEAARYLGRDLINIERNEIEKDMGPCLVSVNSLNVEGYSHSVTWTGKEILDPNCGYEGRKWWGPEWSPWTMNAFHCLVLLEGTLSNSERKEYDEYLEKRRLEQLMAVKQAVIDQLNKQRSCK